MHGNVNEWCEDVRDPEFYSKPESREKDPLCTSGAGVRVVRGGGRTDDATYCRSAFRAGFTNRDSSLGFRPVALGFRIQEGAEYPSLPRAETADYILEQQRLQRERRYRGHRR